MKQVHCIVMGKVQNVQFREYVYKYARAFALRGAVANLPNGSVEVYAQGDEDNIERLIEKMRKGPFLSKVMDVQVEWQEPTGTFEGFEIVY
jgi:acylphosphatase